MDHFQENAPLLDNQRLGAGIHRLIMAAPRIAAAARPGQFVMVSTAKGPAPLLRRPLSIHRVDDARGIGLLFKVVGQGTRLLAELRPGDTVDLLGPFGRGFSMARPGPLCLVGGGMGIAPLAFLADRLGHGEPDWWRRGGHCVLLGARDRAELAPLAADFAATGDMLGLATDDGSMGHHGFVTELFEQMADAVKQVYVCGPHPMMRIIALACIKAGIPCEVSLETAMACGLGACLGCTVASADGGYLHVCTNGPVMDARKVLWSL